MTQLKKLKKAIRARARKTGESYTSARRHVLRSRGKDVPTARPAATTATAAPGASSKAPARAARERAGLSEQAVLKKTGHGLAHWFGVLDTFGAKERGHTASARHLHEDHGVPGWHCQMITVAYERERGLRELNQSCAGDFQVSVSRTLPASVARVARALSDPRRRAEWLRDADPGLRRAFLAAFEGPKATSLKQRDANNARLRYRWDGTFVDIYVTGKPNGRTVVAASNNKLAGAGQVEERRRLWKTALDALKAHLAG